MKLPHDRVTVRVGPPVSNAFAMKDVSRQDIAGRHGGLLQTPCFSGRCNSTLKNEAFLILDFKFQISDFDLKRSLLFILLLTAPLPSCQRQAANVAPSASGTKTVPMRVVTDDLGRRITVPVRITRAISLAPSVTEMIFAAGGGDRLVGVTTFCNYPAEARSIAKVGDTMNPNMESIVGLKPEVVFVSTASQIEAFTKTLEANGAVVYVMDPRGVADIPESIKHLGIIFDNYDGAREVADRLLHRELDLCQTTRGCLDRDKDGPGPDAVRVFVQISKEPLFTVGKDSVLDEVIQNAGGLLITSNIETAFPKLSKETASALQPDAIILSASEDNKEPNEVFKNSPAVRNGRVYSVDADLLSRPGPRVFDAMEQIARDLHPEKFVQRGVAADGQSAF